MGYLGTFTNKFVGGCSMSTEQTVHDSHDAFMSRGPGGVGLTVYCACAGIAYLGFLVAASS